MNDSNPRIRGGESGVAPAEPIDGPIARPRTLSFSSSISTQSRVFCSVCQEIVSLVTAAEAAAQYNTDLQDIRFLLDRHEIHSVPRDPAVISLCRNSLAECFDLRKTRLLDSHFETEVERSMNRQPQ